MTPNLLSGTLKKRTVLFNLPHLFGTTSMCFFIVLKCPRNSPALADFEDSISQEKIRKACREKKTFGSQLNT
jgi:hypothetical protein